MDLWIGNATRQKQTFTYKVPEVGQFRFVDIEPGRQIKIPNLAAEEVNYIVQTNSMYGLISQDTIDRSQAFHGTCYSIDKPISATRLTYLMDHNIGELVELGREIRKVTAVAQSMNVDRALSESNRPERVLAMDVTIQQENQDPNNSVPQMSVGTSVTNDPGRQSPSQGRRRAA